MKYLDRFDFVLMDNWHCYVVQNDFPMPRNNVGDPLVGLNNKNGVKELSICHRFAWNGPSFPFLKYIKRTLQPSLRHDALYYLIYNGHLPLSARQACDEVWYRSLLEEGLPEWFAYCLYLGVRIGGNWTLRHPQKVKEVA